MEESSEWYQLFRGAQYFQNSLLQRVDPFAAECRNEFRFREKAFERAWNIFVHPPTFPNGGGHLQFHDSFRRACVDLIKDQQPFLFGSDLIERISDDAHFFIDLGVSRIDDVEQEVGFDGIFQR